MINAFCGFSLMELINPIERKEKIYSNNIINTHKVNNENDELMRINT